MARNHNPRTFKLSVRRNTKYADNVQMKMLDWYCKQRPPPTSKGSKLKLGYLQKGVSQLLECEKSIICNYLEGFLRGFRKKMNKQREYVDIYEEYVKKERLDEKAKRMSFYSYKTYRNKVSNTVNSLNRRMQIVAERYQKMSGTDKSIPEHWKTPPYLAFGKDVETLSAKKVM